MKRALERTFPSPDKPEAAAGQDEAALGGRWATSGRISVYALIQLRWIKIGLELATLLAFRWLFGVRLPLAACVMVLAVAAAFNLYLIFDARRRRRHDEQALAGQIGFDIAQYSTVMFLTGGVLNPFALLLIAPVALAAATLRRPTALALGLFAAASVVALGIFALPLPWIGPPPAIPLFFHLAFTVAILFGMIFIGGYAWAVAAEAERMEVALNVTQTVLAREQRLSALGGLAAAAAHELGTPLATISIVAKELVRGAPEGPVRDDAELLVSQAERCREILRRLTETPETDDALHARMSLLQFADEIIDGHRGDGVRVEAVVAGPPGDRPPEIRRMPEVLHAMTSLVENAVDFAASEVLVRVRFDAQMVSIEVRDDGPGFSPDILVKLGQPYITSRPEGEGSRTGHQGMGLGFFIAKTLLERTGAAVDFYNGRLGGAIVAARWTRQTIEAPEMPFSLEFSDLDANN